MFEWRAVCPSYAMRAEIALTEPTKKKEQQATEVNTATLPLSSAVRTGLEPATPGVTGRYSNHLNYRTKVVPIRKNLSPNLERMFVPVCECKVILNFYNSKILLRKISEKISPGKIQA